MIDLIKQSPALAAIPRTRRNRSLRSVTGILLGLVLVAGSIGTICAGAFAGWVSSAGTYLELGGHGVYSTDRYALTTDATNWRTEFLGWADAVRVRVASDGRKPVFAGVAAR